MISIDRKMISAIQKLTDSFHDELHFDSASSSLQVIQYYREVLISLLIDMLPEEAEESIERLIGLGYLRKVSRWYGGYSFCMTPALKHRRAFWWDAFSKKFWGGFVSGLISGIIITTIGGLLLSFLRVKLGI